MEIILKGKAEDIAALVLAIRERPEKQHLLTVRTNGDPNDLIQKYNEFWKLRRNSSNSHHSTL